MNIQEFKNSMTDSEIPAGLTVHMQSLWYDGKGDWTKAHDLIDSLGDKRSAHLHAYLHRKEGDLWNADYWYTRAGQKRPDISLQQEWDHLVVLFMLER
ncbi:hypothetical protein [Pedobacter psychroterrae]|uniref:Uncharacterized protein n=1 Tax=Pedobacter psychroterrae TaxID=2530453 RepID=A0A4R0NAT0_9SPHI|nr:hypothetical protein [Pedobacter psychroterrae]TCC97379.1 hypothetical protein EZ437_20035 [Pedobacter psychroterrae]